MLGPPASGKGTQAEFLSEKLKIPNISVGQLLRDEVDKKGERAAEIEEQMNSGGLVSNAIVNELVKNKLSQDEIKQGFIFDGFPRIRIQAKYLDTLTDISHVLHVEVSDQEVENRLSGRRTCSECGDVYHLKFNPPKQEDVCDKCGGKLETREDDTPAGIKKRLKIYHQETEEVVEFYEKKGVLIKINGEQPIEDVKKEIFSKLDLE